MFHFKTKEKRTFENNKIVYVDYELEEEKKNNNNRNELYLVV